MEMPDSFGVLPLNPEWTATMIIEMTKNSFQEDIPALRTPEAEKVLQDILAALWHLAFQNGYAAGRLDSFG